MGIKSKIISALVSWLNWFNAELSPKRYWARSQETTLHGWSHHQNDSCMKMGSDESHYLILMFYHQQYCEGQSQNTAVSWHWWSTTHEEKQKSNRGPSAADQTSAISARPTQWPAQCFWVWRPWISAAVLCGQAACVSDAIKTVMLW